MTSVQPDCSTVARADLESSYSLKACLKVLLETVARADLESSYNAPFCILYKRPTREAFGYFRRKLLHPFFNLLHLHTALMLRQLRAPFLEA